MLEEVSWEVLEGTSGAAFAFALALGVCFGFVTLGAIIV